MSKKNNKAQVIKKRLLSIGLKISIVFLALLFLASIVISIPAVQTKIINKLSDSTFDKINHNLDIEYINIRWFDTILIKGLLIYDTKNKKMVKADRVILDFKLGELITKNSINFDKAIFQGLSVQMLRNAPEDQFNFNFFIDQIKKHILKKKPGKKGREFVTDKIVLTNSGFKIHRDDKELITHRFDQYHFTLKELEAGLTDFMIKPGMISFTVDDLQCIDSATGLDIRELKTKFVYTRQSMVFQNMDFKAGKSSVTQSMVFNYLQPSSVKEFVDSVKITANVKKSIIHSDDLAHFAPSLRKYNEYYRLKGYVEGPVNRFNAKNITLEFGRKSALKGYLSMYGLPNFNETFISAKINSGKVYIDDLKGYMTAETFGNLEKFGVVNLNGRFSGFPGDFVSMASFKTNIGDFDTDINLKIEESDRSKSTYSGKLKTRNFDLGTFLKDTAVFQFLDLNGSINGRGFARENARFDLVSTISRIGIKGYDYQNIKTDAVLAEQFFNGNLIIDDPNLQFNGHVGINLNEEMEVIQMEAHLGKANLDVMKITDQPAFLSSTMNVDMRGLGLDDILGDIFLDNTYFRYNDKELQVDRLMLTSEKDSLSRTLKIQSPVVDVHIFGDFDYSAFFQDLVDVYEEYGLIFRNDSEEIKNYYANQTKDYSDYYYLDYDINLKDMNSVINLFLPEFYLSENTRLYGGFTGGPTKLVQLNSKIDALTVDKFTFKKNSIDINTTKNSDTTLVYATYEILSESQQINGKNSGKNLICEVDWDGNEVDFLFNIEQSNAPNYVKTSGKIEFLPDITNIKLRPSELNLIDKIWKISEDNFIAIKTKQYDINNLSIYHGDQKITFNGRIDENPDENLFISVINFDVENLNPLITKRLDGVFNGFIDIKDYFNQREINSRINVKDFSINEFPVGNIIAFSEFDNLQNHFDVNLKINRNGVQTVNVEGFLKPSAKTDQYNLEAAFTNTNLNLIEPFFEEYISDVSGQLNGALTVSGKFGSPVIHGSGTTEKGAFTIDYFKTHYAIDGQLVLNNNHMEFQNFTLTDNYGNKGNLKGTITHNGFRELEYDFEGDMEKLLVLNTTSKDNNSYYGTAFATGAYRIFGKEKIFNISASGVSEKGTKFYIPLEGSSEVVREEFINFISINDTIALEEEKEEKNKIKLSGINLNLDLDITPDAYCEIIFDLTAGDIIRGRGNGKLNLQIDTKGDFNMFGDYEIEQGGYNFTLYNIINKEFEIEPNSKISWIGDPYEAILDIRANYRQLASIRPIFERLLSEEEIEGNPELNRKYPAKVLLDIKGNLLYPEIGFDIEVEDYPKNATYGGISVETQMTAFKNKLATDEQELKRQVFSLIILKNFSPENAFNVGGSVEKSVSEFISNQISYWVTQFDENLEVDVDLGSLDDEAFNTFQLRMSYSFLDGRLRVTRDGRFSDQTNGTNVSSVLGDWSVEYLLSQDGKLRAKIYNKTNYNTLNPNLKPTSTTAGFSIMHTQSFDEIKNIFKKTRRENRPEEIERSPENQSTEEGISQMSDPLEKF
ncbi:MAG: translocation/assembly module TamB domain-containing protein [Cytophagales bacterium]|nr:translocation/assembly module TamB domain-containing protein [Cytophagales bacterium]